MMRRRPVRRKRVLTVCMFGVSVFYSRKGITKTRMLIAVTFQVQTSRLRSCSSPRLVKALTAFDGGLAMLKLIEHMHVNYKRYVGSNKESLPKPLLFCKVDNVTPDRS